MREIILGKSWACKINLNRKVKTKIPENNLQWSGIAAFMGLARFGRPKGAQGQLSPNLFVANCGPAVGLSHDAIAAAFGAFGEVKGVYAADESGARVVVSFAEEGCAQNALNALHGRPCALLGGRTLHIRYSVLQPTSQVLWCWISSSKSDSFCCWVVLNSWFIWLIGWLWLFSERFLILLKKCAWYHVMLFGSGN